MPESWRKRGLIGKVVGEIASEGERVGGDSKNTGNHILVCVVERTVRDVDKDLRVSGGHPVWVRLTFCLDWTSMIDAKLTAEKKAT